MNNTNWLDDLPADQRLGAYLEDLLSGDNFDRKVSDLAAALGYSRPLTIRQWISGTAKVPLKALTVIAAQLGRDVADILPLWVAQAMGDADDDRLYKACKRMLSQWEFSLVAVARDIYAADDS